MRTLIICLIVQCVFACKAEGNISLPPIMIHAASYNIRYASPDDIKTGNGWSTRKEHVARLIYRHEFDIVGTQEGDQSQIKDLSLLMPDFGSVSHGYGGKNHKLHTATIFYKKEKFAVIESGVFWLSETPAVESIGWDASDTRICQWVKFKELSTSRTFYFFNTHFYWRKQIAKEQSGPLLNKMIQQIAKDSPVILTGDFNSLEYSPQIKSITKNMQDTYRCSQSDPKGPEATGFPGGVFQGTPNSRIDYVFVSKSIEVLTYQVYDDQYDNRYPSDHLPVSSLIRL